MKIVAIALTGFLLGVNPPDNNLPRNAGKTNICKHHLQSKHKKDYSCDEFFKLNRKFAKSK